MPDEQTFTLQPLDRVLAEVAAKVRAATPPTTAAAKAGPRHPVWPVWIAPLVAGIYYFALKEAFAHSIGGVVFDASDVDLNDLAAPQWGSHWIYRTFAEVVSIAFGTFVAAGIARQRAKAAAIVGAIAISTVYLLRTAAWLYASSFSTAWEVIEPAPQHIVEAIIIIGAPFIGAAVSGAALQLTGPKTVGFAGINRLHFLWLWFPASCYAYGIITPLMSWMSSQLTDNIFEDSSTAATIHAIVCLVPIFGFLWPATGGLVVLSGEAGCSRSVKNMVGPAILVIGWIVAACIQFYWARLLGWAFG